MGGVRRVFEASWTRLGAYYGHLGRVLGKKLKKVRKDITSGVSVSKAFSRHSGFPEPVLKQLSMVQSVDDLGTGFEKNVQYYEESITRNTAKLNAMIEPLMMVFLAGMVLVFLLALYLPLFQLGEWI